jgi:fructoselysine-6-P-deglycase FrlB-like protein
MSTDLSVIEGAYLGDILNQPQALEDTLANLGRSRELETLAVRLSKGKFHRVVLTGMGSSFHALHPVSERIKHRTPGSTAWRGRGSIILKKGG